ncbi:hypothetical protein BN903_45 [Halorubrum sp. AJ67]|nr:hypothetical protein BN903_45 [Halorubrum sp. AJ67]
MRIDHLSLLTHDVSHSYDDNFCQIVHVSGMYSVSYGVPRYFIQLDGDVVDCCLPRR